MFITFLIRVFALCRLDDPLDAVAVHGGGGVIGVLMQPFFAYGNDDDNNPLGIFWGASGLVTHSNFGFVLVWNKPLVYYQRLFSLSLSGTCLEPKIFLT